MTQKEKIQNKPTMVPTRVHEPVVPTRVKNNGNFIVKRRERPRNRGETRGIRIS